MTDDRRQLLDVLGRHDRRELRMLAGHRRERADQQLPPGQVEAGSRLVEDAAATASAISARASIARPRSPSEQRAERPVARGDRRPSAAAGGGPRSTSSGPIRSRSSAIVPVTPVVTTSSTLSPGGNRSATPRCTRPIRGRMRSTCTVPRRCPKIETVAEAREHLGGCEPQQRRLAGAVRAEQRPVLPRLDPPVDLAQEKAALAVRRRCAGPRLRELEDCRVADVGRRSGRQSCWRYVRTASTRRWSLPV